MEIPQPNQKMTTIKSHQKKMHKEPKNFGQKSNNKLNISDYISVNKKRLSKKLSQKFGDIILNLNDKNDSNNKNTYTRKGSFVARPKIKRALLKEYEEQIKLEKKFRKLKIIQNLYDSSEEDSEEEDQNKKLELYIDSESYFILIFDILVAFYTFYILLFIPLNLTERKNYIIKEKLIYITFNIITEVLYILDLCFCFFKTYYNYEYKKITNINEIILNYITNDFFFDFIEAFPSYIICKSLCYKNIGINVELTRFEIFMTIFRMVKALKIWKVLSIKGNRAFELLYEKLASYYFLEIFIGFFVFFFKIFSFLHILICIHIFLGWQSNPNWMININIIDENLKTKYISSFYFIIETMTTVGYGDIICISFIEQCFQLILLTLGIVSYSFIVSKFGNYVLKKSNLEIELDNKINQLEQIRIQYPSMPYKLYLKIQNYFRKKSKKHNNKNEMTNLINNLPDKLRNDILLIIYRDVINKFRIFKNCNNTDFITQICSSFIQVTCEKETILLMEGKKVENIFFVKEGRLILEAVINLNKPSESYEKYFRENFKSINLKELQKSKFSASTTHNNTIDLKQLENANYMKYLEERLMNNNKIGKKRNSLFDTTKNTINSVFFQIGSENDDQEKDKDSNNLEKEHNYKYLKILDIRKNEHFGDFYIFEDKPAPLTLKVKSKFAKLFVLKKKDAIAINNIHHNIMNRIKEKSLKNLISIKNKTKEILKQYIDNKFTKIKRNQLQNASWFNEKSRYNNTLHDITNFLNNSINIIEKGDISANSPINVTSNKNYFFMKPRTPERSKNNYLELKSVKFNEINTIKTPKNNRHIKISNMANGKYYETEFVPSTSKNNFLHLNYEPKIRGKNKSLSLKMKSGDVKLKMEEANNTIISQKNKSFFSKKSNTIKSDESPKKTQVIFISQETKNLSKSLNKSSLNESSSFNYFSPERAKNENKITTINDINSGEESFLRKKIKYSVQKQKILKLCKTQKKIIESYEKTINSENKENEELKKINELNTMIYNKLLEYLDTEPETEIEGDNEEINNKKYKIEKTINFNIKSSYSNLNNLTKGKIIINNNYKIDIKNLIQNYIKEKNKNKLISLDYLVKNYYKDYQDKPNKKSNFHVGSFKKKKKVKFKNRSSKNLKAFIQKEENTSQILSNQIKKTITNKIETLSNYKNTDQDDKLSNIKLNISKIGDSSPLKKYNFFGTKPKKENVFTKLMNSLYSKFNGK